MMTRREQRRVRELRIEKHIRDAIIFIVSIAGVVNELWFMPEVRWHVLVFLASMLGYPIVEAADRQRRNGDDDDQR